MADPRVSLPFEMTPAGPKTREANLSPLMRAKNRASAGEKVNACPYGCSPEQLDEHGYCRHLVGFTADQKTYEPLVRRRGRYLVQVERDRRQVDEEEVELEVVDPESGQVRRLRETRPVYEYGPPLLPRVEPSDRLVQITTSYRVYRNLDNARERPTPLDPVPEPLPVTAEDVQKMVADAIERALEKLTRPAPAATEAA